MREFYSIMMVIVFIGTVMCLLKGQGFYRKGNTSEASEFESLCHMRGGILVNASIMGSIVVFLGAILYRLEIIMELLQGL